jgi:hypothetical protein
MSHCSILKAIRPEQPNGASPSLFFRGLWLQRLLVAVLSSVLSISQSLHRSLLKYSSSRAVHCEIARSSSCITIVQSFAFSLSHSLILTLNFSPVGATTFGVAGAPPHSALLTLMLLFLPFRRGSAPPQCLFLDPL